MAENVPDASEVEIAVVGEVHRRGTVGCASVINPQLISVRKSHYHSYGQVAGITFLTVWTGVSEFYSSFLAGQNLRCPQDFVETSNSAVEMVRAVVDGQLVFFPVELEPAFGGAVGHTPNSASQIAGIPGEVLLQVIKPKHDITEFPPAIRHLQFGDNRAVVGDLGDEALSVGQREQVNALTGRSMTEKLFNYAGIHVQSSNRRLVSPDQGNTSAAVRICRFCHEWRRTASRRQTREAQCPRSC